MKRSAAVVAGLCLSFAAPVFAQEDAEDCKDTPFLNRMPNFRISSCEGSEFDAKRFPMGLPTEQDENGTPMPTLVELEGAYTFYRYELNEGFKKPSDLQIMRNFENAAKKAGALIGSYPGWCEAVIDDSLGMGNNCINHGVAMKFAKDGKETWLFMETADEGAGYELHVMTRQAMEQAIVASELHDAINKVGFVAVYLNFDTGKATLQATSLGQVEQIADLLKKNSSLRLEVGGHTDKVGNEKANQKLSEARARTVMKALIERGIKADRLTAKGYGASVPIADNRIEEGRAKNRRVELLKR